MAAPLLEIRNVKKYYPVKKVRNGEDISVKAVDQIDLTVNQGEIVGLVGESGCGKSTLGKTILKLHDITGGQILFHGEDITNYTEKQMRPLREKIQIIFQDPYASLNPKKKVVQSVMTPLDVSGKYTKEEKEAMAEKKNDNYKELIKQITPEDILPGILPFLKELKAEGIRIALASVSKNAPFIIDRLQLNEYFDYIADAASVPNAKPFPDIFLAGRDEFGFESCECIGVEDAKTGIEAIHRADMKAIGVGTPDQMAEADLLTTTDKLNLSEIRQCFDME